MNGQAPPAGLEIRAAGPGHLAGLVRLEAAAMLDPWPESQLAIEIAQAGGLLLVALAGAAKEVVGSASFRVALDDAELLRLAVSPLARRRGIASALLAAAGDRLARRGVRRFLLEVREDNAGAIAFYQARGFAEIGRRPGYFRDGTTALVLATDCPRPGADGILGVSVNA